MKAPFRLARSATVIFMLGLVTFSSLQGATLFWGTRPNDTLLDSQGNALTASFTFELGTFSSGFTPTEFNLDQWAANWMVFDAAVAGNGWDPIGQEVAASANHTAGGGSDSSFANPTDVFAQGASAYLWVFNTKDLNSAGAEWALLEDVDNGSDVLDAWEFPDPAEQSGQSYDLQTRDLDSAIFGGVNKVQGPGVFAVSPIEFTIQTALVPEPGSAMLLVLGGFWLLRRGRRFVS